jgi:hypothetical protein
MSDNRFSVFGVVPGLKETPTLPGDQQAAADFKAQQAAAKAGQTPADEPRRQPLVAGAPVQPQPATPPTSIAAGFSTWAQANMALVDVEYRNNFPQEA